MPMLLLPLPLFVALDAYGKYKSPHGTPLPHLVPVYSESRISLGLLLPSSMCLSSPIDDTSISFAVQQTPLPYPSPVHPALVHSSSAFDISRVSMSRPGTPLPHLSLVHSESQIASERLLHSADSSSVDAAGVSVADHGTPLPTSPVYLESQIALVHSVPSTCSSSPINDASVSVATASPSGYRPSFNGSASPPVNETSGSNTSGFQPSIIKGTVRSRYTL